jgi:nucleotide-binding universal stress UspA family protein
VTVVAAYLPDKGGRASLDLAVQLVRAGNESLTVATVVPRQWSTPSLAKIDAEYAQYARRVGDSAERRGRQYLSEYASDLDVRFVSITGRSVPAALIECAEDVGASTLVLGSSADGQLGHIVIGSTAARLLHSSPVPVALAPRGYRSAKNRTVARITCAFSDTPSSVDLVRSARNLAAQMGVGLRVLTVGVRQASMYPPEVGLSVEEQVLQAWARQATAAQGELTAAHVIDEGVTTLVATGQDWADAMDSVEWEPDEIFVVGSSSVNPVVQVFLGSRATKLVRHSPVPVLVLAGTPA